MLLRRAAALAGRRRPLAEAGRWGWAQGLEGGRGRGGDSRRSSSSSNSSSGVGDGGDDNGRVVLDFDAGEEIRAARGRARGGSVRNSKLAESLVTARLGRRRAAAVADGVAKKIGHARDVVAFNLVTALTEVLEEERIDVSGLSDPRSAYGDAVVITRATVGKDKRNATVYWVLPSHEEAYARRGGRPLAGAGLAPQLLARMERLPKTQLEHAIDRNFVAATGAIRHQLFLTQRLKLVPQLEFRRDEQRLKMMRMNLSLQELEKS